MLATILAFLPVLSSVEDQDIASIGGRVTETSGAPIAGAKVSVRNKFSNEFEITKSNTDGFYRIEGLRQGNYSVFAQAEGYGCIWVLNVLLYRGEHTNLDLALPDAHKRVSPANCIGERSTQ